MCIKKQIYDKLITNIILSLLKKISLYDKCSLISFVYIIINHCLYTIICMINRVVSSKLRERQVFRYRVSQILQNTKLISSGIATPTQDNARIAYMYHIVFYSKNKLSMAIYI